MHRPLFLHQCRHPNLFAKKRKKKIHITLKYIILILAWSFTDTGESNKRIIIRSFKNIFRKVTKTVYILQHNRCRLPHTIQLSSDRCQRRIIQTFQPLQMYGVIPELVVLTLSLQDCLFGFHASGPSCIKWLFVSRLKWIDSSQF